MKFVSWLAASASSKCITPLKYVTKLTASATFAKFSKPNAAAELAFLSQNEIIKKESILL